MKKEKKYARIVVADEMARIETCTDKEPWEYCVGYAIAKKKSFVYQIDMVNVEMLLYINRLLSLGYEMV